MTRPWKALGACIAASALLLALTAPSAAGHTETAPLESPGFDDECFEWTYPDDAACGELKGKEECKASPTIENSDDEDKKEKCKPKKGDECFCD